MQKSRHIFDWAFDHHALPYEILILLASENQNLYQSVTSGPLAHCEQFPPDTEQTLAQLLERGRRGELDISLNTVVAVVPGVPEAVMNASRFPNIKNDIFTKSEPDGTSKAFIKSDRLYDLVVNIGKAMK